MVPDWLLAPLTVQDFFAEVWGVADRHIQRSDPGYFTDRLPGLSTIDEILEHVRSDPSVVRAVKSQDFQDQQTRDFGAYRQLPSGTLDLARVHADYDDGYTILLTKLERYVPSLTALSNTLEGGLNYPVSVNAYLSPAGSSGHPPHYDSHDVLALQVQGSKLWHLYGDEAVPAHKMRAKEMPDPSTLPAPSDLRLTAGDTFYLPRGRIHTTEAATEPSVHLTIGVHIPTVYTLLTSTVTLLSRSDDRFHTRLPPRVLDDPDVRAGLGAMLHEVLGAIEEPEAFAEGLAIMKSLAVQRRHGLGSSRNS